MARLLRSDAYYGRVIAAIVIAAGLLATYAGWRAVQVHESAEVRWVTRLAGQVVRSDILTDLQWQMVGLDRLALLWDPTHAGPSAELWTRNAELYLEHRPGSVAIEWLSADGQQQGLITKRGNPSTTPLAFGGMPTALLAMARAKQAVIIGGPATVSNGSSQWAIVHPVFLNGQHRGFIISFFDLSESWDYILADLSALGFSYAVLPPNQPEYLLPGSTRDNEQQWGEVVDIPLAGVTWLIRVWPKPDVLNVIESEVARLTLASGTAVSLLLGLTVYFAFGAASSSARTQRANEALQREITVREGAQEELRRAHAELEVRIDRRTADLAGANALLQREVAEHQRAEHSLQELTGRLFHLQDDERRRLARELHDGAVQNLIALTLDLGMIRDGVAEGDTTTRQLVDECRRLADQSTSELRTISYLLHPPYFDELGVSAALRDFVSGFSARSGIHVTLDLDPNLGRVGHQVELSIYRVVQEALSNVHRHSRSRTARVSLSRTAELIRLEIADEGRGIPPEVLIPGSFHLGGVGIAGMRERMRLLGGELEIHGGAGGTTIVAVVPLRAVESNTSMSESAARSGEGRASVA